MVEYKQGKITQRIFDAVKILFENGGTNQEIAKFMKLSNSTVSIIRNSETYDEYKANCYVQTRARKTKRVLAAKEQEQAEQPQTPPPQIVEHRQTVTVQATWQMTQEMQKTNELLRQISNKLAYIVDELCGVKTDAKPDN